jgi:hypothetical protein
VRFSNQSLTIILWTGANRTLTTPIQSRVRGIPGPLTNTEGQGERDKL